MPGAILTCCQQQQQPQTGQHLINQRQQSRGTCTSDPAHQQIYPAARKRHPPIYISRYPGRSRGRWKIPDVNANPSRPERLGPVARRCNTTHRPSFSISSISALSLSSEGRRKPMNETRFPRARLNFFLQIYIYHNKEDKGPDSSILTTPPDAAHPAQCNQWVAGF